VLRRDFWIVSLPPRRILGLSALIGYLMTVGARSLWAHRCPLTGVTGRGWVTRMAY
jgi:hypothetical protein